MLLLMVATIALNLGLGVGTAYSDEAGRGFRFEAGRHSEAKPATGPI